MSSADPRTARPRAPRRGRSSRTRFRAASSWPSPAARQASRSSSPPAAMTTTRAPTSTTETTASDDALAQFGEGDLGIVNYALTLEYLEAAFYDEVAKSGLFKGADLALIRKFGDSENEHVVALTATAKSLGGKPAPKPKTQFDLADAETVLTDGDGRREPRRRRLSGPGGRDREPADPGGGALDPLGRGSPRGRPEPAHRQADHPGRPVRGAGRRPDGPGLCPAVHRQLTTTSERRQT